MEGPLTMSGEYMFKIFKVFSAYLSMIWHLYHCVHQETWKLEMAHDISIFDLAHVLVFFTNEPRNKAYIAFAVLIIDQLDVLELRDVFDAVKCALVFMIQVMVAGNE
jgi:hypothetical protein